MTDYTIREGFCKQCKASTRAKLHLRILCSGAEVFSWVCSTCEAFAPFGGDIFIDSDKVFEKLTKTQIQELPVMMIPSYGRCARCGNRGTEEHHWAPKEIFGDKADSWPTDRLCLPCHIEWHEKMNIHKEL